MIVLLLVCGALAVFAAGWTVARTLGSAGTALDPAPSGRSRGDSFHLDVLERHPTGVVVCGPDGAVDYRNETALELAGTHVGVLVDEAVSRHLEAACQGTSSGETLELYGPPKRVVQVFAEPLDAGRAVAFIDDISDRRRADQARTDFVANVSHELRTPIGALMALAESLDGERDDEVLDRLLARMRGEGERAARTIDDLLQLSQIEAGLERDVGRVRLSDVVNEAVGRVRELAAANEITISTLDPVGADGPVAEQSVVRGDRSQLASAVGNLVENAVKYSDPGDVVQVRVRRDNEFGEVSVIDEGVGIPRRDLDRVFERFYRVDRARSRTTGGTGLGLSIVRHVAASHGGSVVVDSVEGDGSTFVLRLPLAAMVGEGEGDSGPSRDGREGVA